MRINPAAVSAVACGVVIPGVVAASVAIPRAIWRAIEQVGRAQDDTTEE